MPLIEIEIISYPPEVENLVSIWCSHSGLRRNGIDVIKFVHKCPRSSKSDNRRIAGIKAECLSYLKDDTELVKMSVENFIKLMIKVGVKMRIKEMDDACK